MKLLKIKERKVSLILVKYMKQYVFLPVLIIFLNIIEAFAKTFDMIINNVLADLLFNQ